MAWGKPTNEVNYGMTEDGLNELSLDELFNLMMTSTSDLVALGHAIKTPYYQKKKEELLLIQKVIIAKRDKIRRG